MTAKEYEERVRELERIVLWFSQRNMELEQELRNYQNAEKVNLIREV